MAAGVELSVVFRFRSNRMYIVCIWFVFKGFLVSFVVVLFSNVFLPKTKVSYPHAQIFGKMGRDTFSTLTWTWPSCYSRKATRCWTFAPQLPKAKAPVIEDRGA